MKVRATALCYYNLKRRRKGDVFALLHKDDFNAKCMEDMSKPKEKPQAKAKAPVKQPIRDADGTIIGYKDGKNAAAIEEQVVVDEIKAAQEAEEMDKQGGEESEHSSGQTQSDQAVI